MYLGWTTQIPAHVTGNLANICTHIGQERYPAQVTGNLANIGNYVGQEREPRWHSG